MDRKMDLERGMEPDYDGDGRNNMVDTRNSNDKLFEAVECNSIEDTRYCVLTLKADVNAKDFQDRTPLHIAVESGFGAIVRFLVSNGADLKAENASKCRAVDIGQEKENIDIVNLLTCMESSDWCPGSDPALMFHPKDNEYSDLNAKESLIFERSQISQLLNEASLKHYFSNFESNNIDFIRFLRMDDDSLSKIGISAVEDRRKILDIIKFVSERKWQHESVLPNFMQKDLTSSEIVCMLNNLHLHTQTLNNGMWNVTSQIVKNPDMLRHNVEVTTINNLSSAVQEVSDVTKTLEDSIGKVLLAIGGIHKTKSGHKASVDSNESKRRPMHSWCIYVGSLAGLGILASFLYNRLRH